MMTCQLVGSSLKSCNQERFLRPGNEVGEVGGVVLKSLDEPTN